MRRNFGREIIMKLAPSFSRGAAAFAPVAFPGKIDYPGVGNVGYSQQRQFRVCTPAPREYPDNIAPAFRPYDKSATRFAAGVLKLRGLMPNVKKSVEVKNRRTDPNPGGDNTQYNHQYDNWGGTF